MRHLLAAALLLTILAAAACAERVTRGTSGAYIGGGAGGSIARDR
jgi:opacity protein-like surface antigen